MEYLDKDVDKKLSTLKISKIQFKSKHYHNTSYTMCGLFEEGKLSCIGISVCSAHDKFDLSKAMTKSCGRAIKAFERHESHYKIPRSAELCDANEALGALIKEGFIHFSVYTPEDERSISLRI